MALSLLNREPGWGDENSVSTVYNFSKTYLLIQKRSPFGLLFYFLALTCISKS